MGYRVPFTPLPVDPDGLTYEWGPDSSPRPGVAPGRTMRLELEGRGVQIHVPAAAEGGDQLACVVFQDGEGFLDPQDDLRGGVVLDNVVATGDIPPMVGVFVDPGSDRNAEYDAFDSAYADFLVDEVLPLVRQHARISDEPSQRALCGFSSGGNASFTAAWHRPDAFGKVLAFSASFPQIPGGNPFPRLIGSAHAVPLRILLHVGHRDLGWDEPEDNWFAENLRTAAALAEGGYDARLVVGDAGHDSNHAGVLLPDALRWLWRS